MTLGRTYGTPGVTARGSGDSANGDISCELSSNQNPFTELCWEA